MSDTIGKLKIYFNHPYIISYNSFYILLVFGLVEMYIIFHRVPIEIANCRMCLLLFWYLPSSLPFLAYFLWLHFYCLIHHLPFFFFYFPWNTPSELKVFILLCPGKNHLLLWILQLVRTYFSTFTKDVIESINKGIVSRSLVSEELTLFPLGFRILHSFIHSITLLIFFLPGFAEVLCLGSAHYRKEYNMMELILSSDYVGKDFLFCFRFRQHEIRMPLFFRLCFLRAVLGVRW